jgi:hypothetical protein
MTLCPRSIALRARDNQAMASKARRAFDENCEDIERLLEIHADLGGDARGRRRRLEVLNKSAIVLITSFWEAYCEDLAAEGLEHFVTHTSDATSLPVDLRKQVAQELERDNHELATWKLAGDGWRSVLSSRLDGLREERNRRLNTPKTAQIDELFLRALGVPKVSSSWKWNNMSMAKASRKLDTFVELRGAIAHRGAAGGSVHKQAVADYYGHVRLLVGKTGGRVNSVIKKATGSGIL